jgi:hypothetical protein
MPQLVSNKMDYLKALCAIVQLKIAQRVIRICLSELGSKGCFFRFFEQTC